MGPVALLTVECPATSVAPVMWRVLRTSLLNEERGRAASVAGEGGRLWAGKGRCSFSRKSW